jgi:amino acid permease
MAYWGTVGTVFAMEVMTAQAVIAWWRTRRR